MREELSQHFFHIHSQDLIILLQVLTGKNLILEAL